MVKVKVKAMVMVKGTIKVNVANILPVHAKVEDQNNATNKIKVTVMAHGHYEGQGLRISLCQGRGLCQCKCLVHSL